MLTIQVVPGAGFQRVQAGLAAAVAGQSARLAAAGAAISEAGLAALRQEMPEKTGTLKQNETATVAGGNPTTVRFTNATPYRPYVILGTAPHVIRPVNAQALYWPGAAHPVKLVHHPGTKANDYPARALEVARPAFRAVLEADAAAIVATIGA